MQEESGYSSFTETIYLLRSKEEITLFDKINAPDAEACEETMEFLHQEYKNESLDYPYEPPEFNKEAALWGARLIYFASQLMINRRDHTDNLSQFIPPDDFELSVSSIISSDLCLRFLPDLIQQLILLQSDDPLVNLLENVLQKYHYSGISHLENIDQCNFELILSDPCLLQLFADRVIEKKARIYLDSPVRDQVLGSIGAYKNEYWKEL